MRGHDFHIPLPQHQRVKRRPVARDPQGNSKPDADLERASKHRSHGYIIGGIMEKKMKTTILLGLWKGYIKDFGKDIGNYYLN